MDKVKKIGVFLLDIFTVYVPMITFIAMFISFILQIFSRYVLNDPWIWPSEASVLLFVWTVLLGGCYSLRRRDVVEFTVLVELMPAKWQRMVSASCYLVIAVAAVIAIYPVYDYLQFLQIQRTPVFQMQYNLAFAPFLFTLLFLIGYSLYGAVQNLRLMNKPEENTPADDAVEAGGIV